MSYLSARYRSALQAKGGATLIAEMRAVFVAVAKFSELDKAARRAKKSLRDLQDESKRSEKEYHRSVGKMSDKTDELTESHDDLDKATVRTSNDTEAWANILGIAADKVSDLSNENDDYTASLNKTTKATEEHRKETERDTDAVTELSDAFDGGSDDGNAFTRTLGGLSRNFRHARIEGRNFGAILQTFKFPAIVAGISVLMNLISGLAAGIVALIPRIAQVSGLVGGLPQLFLAAAQSAGALFAGLSGLGDAMKALAAREELATQKEIERQIVAEEGRKSLENMSTEQMNLLVAMEALTPEAQSFTRALFDMKSVLDKFRTTGQEALLPGLERALENLRKLAPVVNRMIGDTASRFARLSNELSGLVSSREFRHDLALLFQENGRFISQMGNALINVISGFRHIAVAARPVVDWLGHVANKWTEVFEAATEQGRASGELRAFFIRSIEAARQLGDIIEDVVVAIFNVSEAGSALGQSMWDSIQTTTQAWREWTGSIEGQNELKQWFEDARPVIYETFGLFGDIIKLFGELMTQADSGELISQIRRQLIPALRDMMLAVDDEFAPALVEIAANFVRLFSTVGNFTGTLTAFANVLNSFLEGINWIIDNVPLASEVLSTFFVVAGSLQGLKFIGGLLKIAFSPLKNAIGWIQGAAGSLTMLGEASAYTGSLLGGLTTVFPKLGAALTILTGPIGWITAALVVAALLIIANWEKVKDFFIDVWNTIWKVIGPIVTLIWSHIRNALTRIHDAWMEVWESLKGPLLALWEQLKPFLAFLAGAFVAVIVGVVIAALEGLALFLEFLADKVEWFIDRVNGLIALVNKIPGVEIRPVGADGISAMETSISGAGAAAADAINHIKGLGEAVTDADIRATAFHQTLDNNIRGARAFASETSQSMAEFRAAGAAAFRESTEAGNDWVDNQIQQLKDVRANYRDTFDASGNALDKFSGKQKVSSEQILNSFDKQLKAQKEYAENWKKVSKRAGDDADGLLEHIQGMGEDGAGLLAALADANKKEFDKIVQRWKDGERGSKLLGESVENELTGSIDKLIRALKNLPEKINMRMNLDTSQAENALETFLHGVADAGVDIVGSNIAAGGGTSSSGGGRQRNEREQRRERDRGNRTPRRDHRGGWAKSGPPAYGPMRQGEVNVRAKDGEFIVREDAAKRHPEFLEEMNRTGQIPSFMYQRMHIGGQVKGNANRTAGLSDALGATLKNINLLATLDKPKFKSPILTGKATGGITQAAANYLATIKANFPQVSGFGTVAVRKIAGQNTWSQHAYGNAVDVMTGASDTLRHAVAMFSNVNRGALKIAHLLADPWFDSPRGDHYDHVHADFNPQWGGTPPGHPMYRGGKATEGMTQTHKGEFVLNKWATRAIGMNNLMGMNAALSRSGLRPAMSPKFDTPFMNLNFSHPSVRPPEAASLTKTLNGMTGSESKTEVLHLHMDGRDMRDTVEIRKREAHLVLSGRKR